VRQLAEVIDPPPLTRRVCRDPDDDAVLALALASKADWIVSGDDDLLVLQTFEGTATIIERAYAQRQPAVQLLNIRQCLISFPTGNEKALGAEALSAWFNWTYSWLLDLGPNQGPTD
jgi:hypothetical protein